MAKYKLVVLTHALKDRDEAFNDWYQNVHLGEVVAVSGFKRAQRFRFEAPVSGDDHYPYLAIYDVETEDPEACLEALKAEANSGRMVISDALAPNIYAALYSEFGEPVLSTQ